MIRRVAALYLVVGLMAIAVAAAPVRLVDLRRINIGVRLYIGRTEVTMSQYDALSYYDDRHPPETYDPERPAMVTWLEATRYCNRLSDVMGLAPVYLFDGERGAPSKVDLVKDVTQVPGADGFRLMTLDEWNLVANRCVAEPWNKHGSFMRNHFEMLTIHEQRVGTFGADRCGVTDLVGNAQEWLWTKAPDGLDSGAATTARMVAGQTIAFDAESAAEGPWHVARSTGQRAGFRVVRSGGSPRKLK